MSLDEIAPTETAPVVADVTPAPIPSDAELEAIERERMPENLRNPRYPREGWQRIGRNILRFAWTLFVAYAVYVGPTLLFTWLDGGITTFTQAAHILALGRLLPFIDELPLDKLPILAIIIPVLLFIALIMAARWAAKDLEREKKLLAAQDRWLHDAVARERAHMQAQAEAQAAVAKIEPQVGRIEDKTDLNTTLGVTAVIQGEVIREDVAATHDDVRATKITVEEIAEQQRQAAADKAPPFTRVRDLDRVSFRMGDRAAANFSYVYGPVRAIFDQATATLHDAAQDIGSKQGILVTGAANAGKTRLGLEALIAALPDWDTLVWNVGDGESRIPSAQQLEGRSVAVFLDDIQNYAAGGDSASGSDGRSAQASVAGPGATLRTLYQRICQEAAHVVIVATCRREDQKAAEGSLGWFFEKLDEVAIPTFNRDEGSLEARDIIAEFAEQGAVRDEWNGTLGSLVLGLGRKRQQYRDLVHQHNPDNPAVPVLRAMKLLTIGGVLDLTGSRVRAVCDQILHRPALAVVGEAWDNALEELKRLEFSAIIPTDDGDMRLAILKDDYFKYVVDDYPEDYQLQQHRANLLNVLVLLGDDDGLFDLGNGFYFDDQFTSAITAYQEAIRLNPTYATAYNNMGNTLGKLGRHDEAITAYQEAIRLNPTYATAYNNMGNTLGKLGRHDEAIAAYQEAIRLNPTDATAYNNMGTTLDDLGRHDEAIAAYQEAIRLNSTYATAYNNMGNTLGKLGRHDEAITAYQEAIRLNPTDATAYNNMGNTLDDLGRHDEAITAYQEAIRLNPTYATAYYNKSVALALSGKMDDALVDCDKAIELAPQDADGWHLKAAILHELGREDEARAAEERATYLAGQQ